MPLERTSTLTVNGISGVDGNYAVPKMSTADLAARLRRSRDSASISPLRTDRGRRLKTRAFPALPLGVRPEDVDRSGWTVVFHRDEDIAVRAALEPLITYRSGTHRETRRAADLLSGRFRRGLARQPRRRLGKYHAGESAVLPAVRRRAQPDPLPVRPDARRGVLRRPARPSGCRRLPAIRAERRRLRESRRDREQERDRLLRHASSLRRCDDAECGLAGCAAGGRVAGAAAVGRGASGRERMVLRPAQVRRRRRPPPGPSRCADPGRQEAAGAALHRDAWNGLAERARTAASGAGRTALPGLERLRRHRDGALPGRGRRSRRGQRVRRDRVSLRLLRRRHAARGSLRSRARRGAAGNRAQAFCCGAARPAADPSRGRSARLHRARRTGLGVFHLRPDHGAADWTVPPGPGPPDARTAGRPGGAGVQRQVRRGIRVAGQSPREGLCRTSR